MRPEARHAWMTEARAASYAAALKHDPNGVARYEARAAALLAAGRARSA